jgi:hypothetical protein
MARSGSRRTWNSRLAMAAIAAIALALRLATL